MKPDWFPFENIPYAQMWPDDRYWLPKVIEGALIREGEFEFKAPQVLSAVKLVTDLAIILS